MIEKITITVSQTNIGKGFYIQLMSSDQTTVNVTLIAENVEINDYRPKEK